MHTYVFVKDWGCSRVIKQWNHTVETVIALSGMVINCW